MICMGAFVCDSCGCIENTALGYFWSRGHGLYDSDIDRKAMCSECMPQVWGNGKPRADGAGGKWHGKFPKVKWDGKREVMNRLFEMSP
jgi:hypothetical protein